MTKTYMEEKTLNTVPLQNGEAGIASFETSQAQFAGFDENDTEINGTTLFSLFTANIIKEEVVFTR